MTAAHRVATAVAMESRTTSEVRMLRHSLLPTLAAVALFSACGPQPISIEGQVTDIWDKPVAEARVDVFGQTQPLSTDSNGSFSFEVSPGPVKLKAGKDGYIQDAVELTVSEDEDAEIPRAKLILYPEPEKPGFYAVGHKQYIHLEPLRVKEIGTDLQVKVGLPAVGEGYAPEMKKPQRFVYSSTLRSSEIAKLELQLSRLEYVKSAPMPGALGSEDVTIDLWAAVESVPYDLKGLPSRDDYLVTMREPLPKGTYAFHTQRLLDATEPGAVARLPREMQVAYPFDVK